MTDEDLLLLRNQLEYDICKYGNFQLVKKVQLNSCYGAVG